MLKPFWLPPRPFTTPTPRLPSLWPQMLLTLMLAQFYNKKQMAAGNRWPSFPTNFLPQKAAILRSIVNFLPLSKQSNIFSFSWKAGPLPCSQITNPLLQPSPKAKLHSLLANSAIYLSCLSLQLTLCISLAKRTLWLMFFPARPPCHPLMLPPRHLCRLMPQRQSHSFLYHSPI